MADVYNAVHLHLVWATWDRLPNLTPDVRAVAYRCILSVGEEHACRVLRQGGYGVFPVAPAGLEKVTRYIERQ